MRHSFSFTRLLIARVLQIRPIPYSLQLTLVLLPAFLLSAFAADPPAVSPPLLISGQIVTLPATAATPAPLASGQVLTYNDLKAMEDQAPASFEILMRPSFKVASGDTARYTMASRQLREAGRITTTLLNMELTPELRPDGNVALRARIATYGRQGRADFSSDTRVLPPDSGYYEIIGPLRMNDRKLFVLLRVDH